MRKSANICWILCLVLVLMTACTGRTTSTSSGAIRGPIDLKSVLSWLPADTETLQVVNGPFWMSNFENGQHDYKNHEITTEEVEKQFEGLTLALFRFGNDLLENYIAGKKVLFALEGSRHFRTPSGLGELPFEGCALAVFEDDLEERRDVFMKDAARVMRIEEIGGTKIAVIQQQVEQDNWTFFIAFPEKGVVLVSTSKQFLQEMLTRMHGTVGKRALPDSLPEWKYVNKTAQFWGLRHYDKQQAEFDPTSPFGGKKSANFPDEEAVGLTYQSDARIERRVILTFLTGAGAEPRKTAEDKFPNAVDPEQMPGLHLQYRKLEPGVIESTLDLSHSEPTNLFFFVFMGHLGHAVYI